MNHQNHIRFGIACWLGAATVVSVPIDPTTAAFAGIGSLLPDLDHPNSLFGQRFRLISRAINAVSQHRGVTHSLSALGVLAVVVAIFPSYLAHTLPLIVGYASAILGDLLTATGVQLFWPSPRWVRLPRPLTFSPGSSYATIFVYLTLMAGVSFWIFHGTPRADLWHWWHRTSALLSHLPSYFMIKPLL